MSYLLDTCVISELIAKQPNQQVVEWIDELNPDLIYLSVITIGEICKGIEKLPLSKRKTELHTWLNDELLIRFSNKILTIDIDVMRTWGTLNGRLELNGQRMAAIDSLIAAVALNKDFTLVTRNEADFQQAGVRLINPWNAV
ncbi:MULTISPECIES: type II toxin-antitoxin system VapC family toxin [Nostocales]|uniref:Recombinase n=3 Tax=Nostocales TaxID=1161 RepID=A0A0C1R4T6_9CYAN|nr:type II toxin-antitoxin system VapC family toxin [Tolypothrix bouteillei]KAF3889173.1 type II toxin-antitoxin system VapC family toxin [Tolypothrix bouteillei VB521301]